MKPFDESEEPLEGKAGDKAPPRRLYDPLMAPWEEATGPGESTTAAQMEDEPGFSPEYEGASSAGWSQEGQGAAGRRPEEAAASSRDLYEPLIGPGAYEGSSPSVRRPEPYAETEAPWTGQDPSTSSGQDLSELRQRLRVEPAGAAQAARARRWSVTAREVVETLLLAVLIFLAVRTSLQNFRVEGQSMTPSLDDGEYLIVNKLAYAEIDMRLFNWLPFFEAEKGSSHHLWGAPSRGDVIVFRSPTNANRDFIKRIIGMPGDRIEIKEAGQVLLNGQVVKEPYAQGSTTCQEACEFTVPPDSYFVMGDNRQNSTDSRQGWYVPEENIIGKALITYWDNGQLELKLAPNRSLSFASGAAAEE